jgi:hypothetical protein
MSIYATLAEIAVRQFGDDEFTELVIQAVPPHIDYTGRDWEFLPPPVDPEGESMRAVFVVKGDTEKGTARCGQEYVDWLVMLTGREWEEIRFVDLLERIGAALDARRDTPRPSSIFLAPDGSRKHIRDGKVIRDDPPPQKRLE